MPLIPPIPLSHEWLTLEELEAVAWHFREQGVSIIAAFGPRGPEWQLRAKVGDAEKTFRAMRVEQVTA